MEQRWYLEYQDLARIEEPTLAYSYDGHARITLETRTPVHCCEYWWGVRDMEPPSSHSWPEVRAQPQCATPTVDWLEYRDWWNPVIAEP